MLLEIICIFILCIPTAWALWDDRNGDVHPNHDLLVIAILSIICASISASINVKTNATLDIFRGLLLSGTICISLFPYLVNIMMYKRGIIKSPIWYDHLSHTAWPDRLTVWKETPWFGRMFFAVVILMLGIMVYSCPYKIVSFDNTCFCCNVH